MYGSTTELAMPSSNSRDLLSGNSARPALANQSMSSSSTAADQLQCDQQHKQLILKQLNRIDSLEHELASVRSERDTLLAENEKLCFQLQMLSECYNGTKRNLWVPILINFSINLKN